MTRNSARSGIPRGVVHDRAASSTIRRAVFGCLFVAAALLMCAGLIVAAVLVPAPPAALAAIVPACIVFPGVAIAEMPEAIAILRPSARSRLSNVHLHRLRRQLKRLPETEHPLGL